MHDKRPALIARCANTPDVVAAVNFARQHTLEVAVRSGGHSVAGLSVCDGGILIDLAGLKEIEVDPRARTARAGGGVLWGEFDAATQQHALHTPGGRVRPRESAVLPPAASASVKAWRQSRTTRRLLTS
jgi:FAD/FMN-containing dehydrogenase